MPADQSPLLASDSDSAQPWLSSGPQIPEISSFSRLISQTDPSTVQFALLGFSSSPPSRAHPGLGPRERSYGSLLTSLFLYILFVGYTVASFLAGSWQETILQIVIGSYEPTDFVLKTRTFPLLLQESDNFIAMLLMWLSYFCIPPVFIILIPLWMAHDVNNNITLLASPIPLARIRTEQLAQAGMLLVWLQAVQNVALTEISIRTTSIGQLLVRNRSGAGWTTFCVAMSCCLALLCVLRRSHALPGDDDNAHGQSTTINDYTALATEETVEPSSSLSLHTMRSPPPEAFARFPFRQRQRQRQRLASDDDICMTVLEETPPAMTHSRRALSTPEHIMMDDAEVATVTTAPRYAPTISYGQRVLVFLLGFASTVLLIPSMYIPIFSVRYHGLAAVFLPETQASFFVWNLANPEQELTHDTSCYNNILLCLIAFSFLVVIPVTCLCLGVLVWLGEGSWSTSSRRILYTLQPLLGSGLVVLVAIIIATTTLDLGDSTQVCRKLFLETECLRLTAQLELGAWLYALQSVLLLLFTHYTLQWSWMCG